MKLVPAKLTLPCQTLLSSLPFAISGHKMKHTGSHLEFTFQIMEGICFQDDKQRRNEKWQKKTLLKYFVIWPNSLFRCNWPEWENRAYSASKFLEYQLPASSQLLQVLYPNSGLNPLPQSPQACFLSRQGVGIRCGRHRLVIYIWKGMNLHSPNMNSVRYMFCYCRA